MRLSDVIHALETLAPPSLAEDWDKVGLHLGDPAQPVRRALLCIDLTEPVLAEAVKAGADLIVAYHPPIFEPLASLTELDWKQRVIRACIRRNIAVYSPHTALDAAPSGLNDWLASILGPAKTLPIKLPPASSGSPNPWKIITFVPASHLDKVRNAMAAAGAGQIGRYSKCSFTVAGEGTFQGDKTTNPAIGKPGRFERTPEVRLEMVCRPALLDAALRALKNAHPYEEPAIDAFEILDIDDFLDDRPIGQGRLLLLDRPTNAAALARRLKTHLRLRHIHLVQPARPRPIRRVALCAGAGGSLLKHAGPIDAFFTGEMRHHDILDAVQRGITILLAGHTQTERPYLPVYRKRIIALLGRGVSWSISRADKPL